MLFLVIKAMNRLKREVEAAPKPDPEPTKEEVLLTEIRDLLGLPKITHEISHLRR